MRNKLPAIIALVLLLALGTLVFGCDRPGTTTSDQEQTDTTDEENGTEENQSDGIEAEEEEAEVPTEYTPGNGPRVVMETSQGNLLIELFPDVAPITVEKITKLINDGFYDGLTFHRYVPDFVIQGGDPKGDGTGGPGFTIKAEFNERPHIKGTLSMARSADPDSAGSQFYFVLGREQAQHLDGQYTVFGHVIEGLDNVDKLREGDVMSKVYMQESQDD